MTARRPRPGLKAGPCACPLALEAGHPHRLRHHDRAVAAVVAAALGVPCQPPDVAPPHVLLAGPCARCGAQVAPEWEYDGWVWADVDGRAWHWDVDPGEVYGWLAASSARILAGKALPEDEDYTVVAACVNLRGFAGEGHWHQPERYQVDPGPGSVPTCHDQPMRWTAEGWSCRVFRDRRQFSLAR